MMSVCAADLDSNADDVIEALVADFDELDYALSELDLEFTAPWKMLFRSPIPRLPQLLRAAQRGRPYEPTTRWACY